MKSLKTLFKNHLHPYTKGLLESLPSTDKEESKIIKGQPPTITENIQGCVFHPRCPYKMNICDKKIPEVKNINDYHSVSCFLA